MAERGARANHTSKILFVCTANVCRSPMAEAIFNVLSEERGLSYQAESAGVAALAGEDITANAREALGEVGIYAQKHRARQVSEEMLEGADLVLAMGPRHVTALRERFGSLSEKVYALPEYAVGAPATEGVPDPYGHTIAMYRASLRQILELVEGAVERLEREGALR